MEGGAGGRHRRRMDRQRRARRRLAGGAVVGAFVLAVVAGLALATPGRGAGSPPSTGTVADPSSTVPHHSPATTVATTPATTAPGGSGPVTLSVVGDTELGNTPDLPPNPAAYLAPVQAALAAPIVFGNLEGTITGATTSKCATGDTDCYAFRVPTSDARVLRQVGFTVLNSANNHSHDFGAPGVADTSAALQAAGIVQAGLPGQIGVVTEAGTRVAFVDFAPYTDTNNLLGPVAARSLITRARSEADVVVVYMHAGAEGAAADHVTGHEESYVGEDRGNPEAFAHAAIDDGASLVVASGPHVLRGMEYYRGHLIAYSLGNFAGYGNFGLDGDLDLSGILKVTLTGAGGLVRASFTSLVLSAPGRPAVDPGDRAAAFVNQLSAEDFGPAAATVGPDGTLSPPPAG